MLPVVLISCMFKSFITPQTTFRECFSMVKVVDLFNQSLMVGGNKK